MAHLLLYNRNKRLNTETVGVQFPTHVQWPNGVLGFQYCTLKVDFCL